MVIFSVLKATIQLQKLKNLYNPVIMEISSIEYNDGKNRLSLEQLEDTEEYRFAWKGNIKSKDGFVNRPAHFEWEQLGQLIRQGFDSGKISNKEIKGFLHQLYKFKSDK